MQVGAAYPRQVSFLKKWLLCADDANTMMYDLDSHPFIEHHFSLWFLRRMDFL
jgi:hypothetical protein